MLLQPAHIGLAAQEPEQFIDDRLEMQLLCRQQREAVPEIEPHLMAENRKRSGSRAVPLFDPVGKDMFQQFLIFAHLASACGNSGFSFNRLPAEPPVLQLFTPSPILSLSGLTGLWR